MPCTHYRYTATTTRHIHVIWCCEDVGPGIHFISPGLLQFTFLWPLQRTDDLSVQNACVGCSTVRPHHAGYTGFLFPSGWTLGWSPWSTIYCPVSSMAAAYLTVNISCHLKKVVVSCVMPTCVVRRTHSSFRDCCLTAAKPKLWNSLSAGHRQMDISYEQFKQLLKTSLGVEITAHSDYLSCASPDFLSHLLT